MRAYDTLAKLGDGAALVLVDPLRGCIPGVDENSMAASLPLALATDVSRATGAAFVFIDHAGKPPGEGATRQRRHMQRGHSSKIDSAQTILAFSATKGQPSLVTCERSQRAPIDRWPADFSFTLSATENGGLRLADQTIREDETIRGNRMVIAIRAEEVTRIVAQRPNLASVEAIAEHMSNGNKRNQDVRVAVKQALADGKITKAKSGGYQLASAA